MLEPYLLDHRWLLVSLTLLITGANAFLAAAGRKAFAEQEWIKGEAFVPPGLGGQIMKSPARQVLGPLIFAAVVCVVALAVDRYGFGLFAGRVVRGTNDGGVGVARLAAEPAGASSARFGDGAADLFRFLSLRELGEPYFVVRPAGLARVPAQGRTDAARRWRVPDGSCHRYVPTLASGPAVVCDPREIRCRLSRD
jgi:hypothetical protein